VHEHSVTFHYDGGRWLRTQLLSNDWPDLGRVLDRPSNPQPVNPQVFEALATIKPFADKLERVLFRDGSMCTHEAEGEGATFAVDGLDVPGVYNIGMLELLQDSAQTVDFATYPGPCMFFGDRLRGAIVGMRA
jgi:hypothetical protein